MARDAEGMGMDVDLAGIVDELPDVAWTAFPDGRADFINRRWCEYTGISRAEGRGQGWWAAVHPDDLPHVMERWSSFLEAGSEGEVEARLRRADGAYRWFMFRGKPLRDETGNIVKWCGTNIDIEDRKQAETQLAVEKHLLEMIASGRAVDDVLEAVCRFVEALSPDCLCGAYPIDWSGPVFKYGVAPSLPPSYVEPIKGWPVRADVAPCGTTAFTKHQMVISDVETDPVWRGTSYRDHVVGHGLRAVWSTPICSLDGRVFGTFCIYQRNPASPSPRHQELISHATHIASIALDRAQADEALRTSELELLQAHAELGQAYDFLNHAQRLSKTGSYTWDQHPEKAFLSDEFRRILELEPGRRLDTETARTIIHPDDLPIYDAMVARGLANEDMNARYRIVTPSGAVKHVYTLSRRLEQITDRAVWIGATQDVTESALADEALKAREAELRRANSYLTAAQRLSRTGSFTWDVVAEDSIWSDEMYRIFDVPAATDSGMNMVRRVVHPDDIPILDALRERLGEAADFDVELRIVTASGLKHVHIVAGRVDETSDRPIFVGAAQDITERKLAEEALRASEAELRRANNYLTTAQQLSKTGSFTWDVKARDTVWSEEMYRIFEADPATPDVNEAVANVVHPDDMPIINSLLSRAIRGENTDVEYRLITASGALKHVHTVAHRIEQITDRPVFVGALQDVTDRKLAEEALRAREAELRRANSYLTIAQKLSKTGSWISDHMTNERQWSEEMYRICEVEPGSADLAMVLRERTHMDDRPILQNLIIDARDGRDCDGEIRLVMPTGTSKTLHVIGHAIGQIDDGPMYVAAAQDITDRKLAEEGLSRARIELAHVSRVTALSALTASIAHEVNQPLAGIVTNASTSLRMLAANPPNIEGAQATAQRTIRDANRAAEVIKRLRALFARRPPGAEPVELNDAVREVLALSSGELQAARVVLQTDLADDLPTIPGDRVQLQQVILNLVLNAAQAMRTIDDRPRELRISTAFDREGQIRLAVRDHGVGADVEHLEQLFNAFFTTKPDGMGVGLSVSRSIVEAHGGRLWASANDGPGLTVSFSIPVASVEAFSATESLE